MGYTVLADLFPPADFGCVLEGMASRAANTRAAASGLASVVFRGRTALSLAGDWLAPRRAGRPPAHGAHDATLHPDVSGTATDRAGRAIRSAAPRTAQIRHPRNRCSMVRRCLDKEARRVHLS